MTKQDEEVHMTQVSRARWRDGLMCEYGEYYDTAKVAGSAE